MASLEYTDGCTERAISGPLLSWPEASYAFDSGQHEARVSWVLADLWNPRSYELEVPNVGELVAPSVGPLLTHRDFGASYCMTPGAFGCLTVVVDYATPVPSWDWPDPTTTTTDFVRICRCPEEQLGDTLQERTFEGPDGLVITTLFYWPFGTFDGGYTAPLVRWVETVIEGLTTEPVVLHGWYSQTYKPEHHNFTEHFIFDPFLDPDVPEYQLNELRDRGVRLIHIYAGYDEPEIYFYGDPDVCESREPIPAMSEWGMAVLMLLVLTAGTLVFTERRLQRIV
jgi:hypothetical protein